VWKGSIVDRSSVVGWGADKTLWNVVVGASRSMFPSAEAARVVGWVEL
jgi:hypothetical protein